MKTSKLCLGTVQFGIDYGVNSGNGQVKPEEVRKILSYAQSKDICLISYSPTYCVSTRTISSMSGSPITYNVLSPLASVCSWLIPT